MRLLSLRLSHFKGAADVSVEPQGRSLSVFGDNACGKTTLADALFWLLFDKDSLGRKAFEIKTIGPDGEPLHRLDHAVEADFELDGGARISLRKVYHETYTRVRGRAVEKFSGHTTDYYVNTVPVKKTEYEDRIADVCSEARFRTLSDPSYFVETLDWQKRRAMLLEVCGDVPDADVIASDPSLAPLPGILGQHSLEEYRKIVASRRKTINAELETTRPRIDEATKALPEVRETGGEDEAALREDLDRLQAERATAMAGGAAAELKVKLAEAKAELVRIESDLRAKGDPERDAAHVAMRAHDQRIADARATQSRLEGELRSAEATRDRIGPRLERLRSQAAAEQAKKPAPAREFAGASSCAACGQELPPERVADALAAFDAQERRRIEEFNAAKAARLGEIVAEGKAVRAEHDAAVADVERLKAEEDAADLALSALRSERQHLLVPDAPAFDPTTDAAYTGKAKEIAGIEAEAERLRTDAFAGLRPLDERIRVVQGSLDAAASARTLAEQRRKGEARIAELVASERRLATEYETLAGHLHLTEVFVRRKVAMLEGRINGRFKVACFRLFREQLNGGLEECCDVTKDGVPYASLNHGSRVNVGLDVVDALAEHFGFAPPIVIDNAESVTEIRPTRGQQVRLVVSAPDKALRIVVDGETPSPKSPRKPKATAIPEPTPASEPEEALF